MMRHKIITLQDDRIVLHLRYETVKNIVFGKESDVKLIKNLRLTSDSKYNVSDGVVFKFLKKYWKLPNINQYCDKLVVDGSDYPYHPDQLIECEQVFPVERIQKVITFKDKKYMDDVDSATELLKTAGYEVTRTQDTERYL